MSERKSKKKTPDMNPAAFSLNFFEFVLELLSSSAISSNRVSSNSVNLSGINSSN